MTALRREAIGEFMAEDAVELQRFNGTEPFTDALLSPSLAVSHLPSIRLRDDQLELLRHGRSLSGVAAPQDTPCGVFDSNNRLQAVARSDGTQLSVDKNFMHTAGGLQV